VAILISSIDDLVSQNKPFFFIFDFEGKVFKVYELNKLPSNIKFSINKHKVSLKKINLDIQNPNFYSYKKQFNYVQNQIKKGNTYLLNLTTKTKIKNKLNLKEIYNNSNAKYKLFFKNKFVSFSPECFIKIIDDKIYTYPMKGTIKANIKNAKEKLINNKKELAEHIMIVDLLRNDLNIVSSNVKVTKFRFIQKLRTSKNTIYQTSSEIVGKLNKNWRKNLGFILKSLLPAGSISGTPKKETLKIIKETENFDRGYFCGIWGVYDGKNLDSAVIIRYIENEKNNFFYKSGGGITIDSDPRSEFNEMLDKIYIGK